MPWSEHKLEELRKEFVQTYMAEKANMSALCREYGISRKTGYKWIERYRRGEQMCDRSRRPINTPNKMTDKTESLVIQIRLQHPAWGARKIFRILQNQNAKPVPSVGTIGNILRRNGLISPQATAQHKPYQRFVRANPNELWQMDFKGDFRMENGERCYPLTILDDCSRYSLCITALPNQRWEGVEKSLTDLFERHGLPDTFLSDNGPPWGNGQSQGMTKFEVWMMLLDVLPIHGRALHPQTQGKEERFHRTMKDELLSTTQLKNLTHAQQKFDEFRNMYNTIRPHEALGFDFPCQHYTSSTRPLPKVIAEPVYGTHVTVCYVKEKGYIRLAGKDFYIGAPLAGHRIAVKEQPDGCLQFCFGNFEVSKFDLIDNRFVSRRIFRLQP